MDEAFTINTFNEARRVLETAANDCLSSSAHRALMQFIARVETERAVCIETCGRILELTIHGKRGSTIARIDNMVRDILCTMEGRR